MIGAIIIVGGMAIALGAVAIGAVIEIVEYIRENR